MGAGWARDEDSQQFRRGGTDPDWVPQLWAGLLCAILGPALPLDLRDW